MLRAPVRRARVVVIPVIVPVMTALAVVIEVVPEAGAAVHTARKVVPEAGAAVHTARKVVPTAGIAVPRIVQSTLTEGAPCNSPSQSGDSDEGMPPIGEGEILDKTLQNSLVATEEVSCQRREDPARINRDVPHPLVEMVVTHIIRHLPDWKLGTE